MVYSRLFFFSEISLVMFVRSGEGQDMTKNLKNFPEVLTFIDCYIGCCD